MVFYEGPERGGGLVRLGSPSGRDLADLADDTRWAGAGDTATDTRDAVVTWTNAARERGDVVLFEVLEAGRPVGQIFLHDIEVDRSESLVGYHMLAERDRGRGIGTEALRPIVDYVWEETRIETLVIITAGDNVRSRMIAEKCGFELVGAPWEDPTAALFKLRIPR